MKASNKESCGGSKNTTISLSSVKDFVIEISYIPNWRKGGAKTYCKHWCRTFDVPIEHIKVTQEGHSSHSGHNRYTISRVLSYSRNRVSEKWLWHTYHSTKGSKSYYWENATHHRTIEIRLRRKVSISNWCQLQYHRYPNCHAITTAKNTHNAHVDKSASKTGKFYIIRGQFAGCLHNSPFILYNR